MVTLALLCTFRTVKRTCGHYWLCARSGLSGNLGKTPLRLIEIFRMYFDTSLKTSQWRNPRGHYVASLKPAAGPHWALFDDHEVQWVPEKSVLPQETTILIYTLPDRERKEEVITILDDDQGKMSSRLCARSWLSGNLGKTPLRLIEIFRMYFDTSLKTSRRD